MRTTRSELEAMAEHLSQVTHRYLTIHKAEDSQKYRLSDESNGDFSPISPLMSAGQLMTWMLAYRKGLIFASEHKIISPSLWK